MFLLESSLCSKMFWSRLSKYQGVKNSKLATFLFQMIQWFLNSSTLLILSYFNVTGNPDDKVGYDKRTIHNTKDHKFLYD